MSKPLYFKDTRVAPNSALGKALESKDLELAQKLYSEANREFMKHNKDWKPRPQKE